MFKIDATFKRPAQQGAFFLELLLPNQICYIF